MAITLGNIVICVVILIVGIFVAIVSASESQSLAVFIGVATILICVLYLGIASWWHTNTASGVRDYKDYKSEMSNGLEREITITAEDGREIFHYEGKVDIESNHEDNYIKFEGEDGCRYMIYYGIQDTIQIIEKKR